MKERFGCKRKGKFTPSKMEVDGTLIEIQPSEREVKVEWVEGGAIKRDGHIKVYLSGNNPLLNL
jgi:hypothetical protein